MPSINGSRAWVETATTLKVPEFKPSMSGDAYASSYIAARPGEAFCLRYDHMPVDGYDLAWRLRISGNDGHHAIEQWGGPPMEMRRVKGIVKVRAMRMSEDGSIFSAFAWSDDANDEIALSGTITLSLHLCHFAEATTDVQMYKSPTQASTAQTADPSHPLLAAPVTKFTVSKLWTWYWRDEQPQLTFVFNYGTKVALQAKGFIPGGDKSVSNGVPNSQPQISTSRKSPMQTARGVLGHKPRISSGALMGVPPRELIKHQQRMRMSDMWRKRGLTTNSAGNESDMSDASSDETYCPNMEHREDLSNLHD